MVFIFFGILFSLMCGVIASNQGRSGFAGAFLGLFFGVFALIGYLIAGDTLAVKARKAVELERLMREQR
jgi:hypothetical protein